MASEEAPNPYQASPKPPDNARTVVTRLGESGKVTVIVLIILVALWFVAHKMKGVTFADIKQGFNSLTTAQIAIACGLTVVNYFILTGYDWIAVRHLRKELPLSKIMTGAVVGYASGNVLGWLFGGNAVRYRLYSTWGFTLVEIIAFVSILSITFWLGLFLLAGIAFVALPVHLPEAVIEMLTIKSKMFGDIELSQNLLGIIFLSCVGGYLLSCLLIRRPIRFRDYSISLPPFRLSAMQLLVSAGDFLLATATLYMLLPSAVFASGQINFSTVLIAYLTAQICAVLTHVPGGYGLLEAILLTFLEGPTAGSKAQIFCAVILFRLIYYVAPFLVAMVLFVMNERRVGKAPPELADGV